ncbi:type VII secretion integral membrane protein EccD [Streptomonospora sediminis]
MTDSTASDLCRLQVRAPNRSFEIAAPTDVPISDLVPTLVLYAEGDEGEDLDESGLEHDGWVLQQLGDDPLDEDETLDSLGLLHGETLHLRPRRDQLPPIHFDDLIDGVATGMAERPDKWRPSYTRVLLQALSLTAILLALAVPAAGGLTLITALTCSASAVVMLLSAWSASRAMGDLPAAAGLAGAAALYMAVAGAAMPTGDPSTALLGARILTGAMTGAGATVLGVAAVAGAVPFFSGLVVVEILLALGALGLMLLPNATLSGVAAGLALLSLLVGTYAPQLSFRISGLKLPPLPANPEQLQQGIDPFPARDVLDRSALADKFQSAMLAATGAVLTCCLVVLALAEGWVATTVCILVALVMLLQTRGLASAWQRSFMTAPPAIGLAVLLLSVAADSGVLGRSLVLLGVFALATILAVLSWSLPGTRPLPHWGRAAEIIQSLITVAIFPLVLAAFGVYSALRAIGG